MKRPVVKIALIAVAALTLIAGCGKKTPQPVAVNEKTDKCALCNMAVKDDHFATELILKNGKTLLFDDLGCMDKWMKQNKDKKREVAYVRDFNNEKWVNMEKASYVHDNQVAKTPMAYNVISFANTQDAQKFVDKKGGKLLAYADLQKYSWKRDPAQLKKLMEMKMKKEAGSSGQGKMEMNKDAGNSDKSKMDMK